MNALGEHARDEHRATGATFVGGKRLGHLDDGDIAIGRRQVVDQRSQIVGCLAADGAAAHDDDLLAREGIAAQQIVSRHDLLKALHKGRSDGLGTISQNDLVPGVVTLNVLGRKLGTKDALHASLGQAAILVLDHAGELLLCRRNGRDAHLAARLVLLVHERHVMSALGSNERRLHACGTGAHNEHVLGLGSGLVAGLVALHVRVDGAGDALAKHDAVQAAQAADARANLVGVASSRLVAELGIAQVGAAHHADVGGAVLDQLLGNPCLIDATDRSDGNVDVLFDLARAGGVRSLLGAGSGNRGAALDGSAARHVDHVDAGLLQATRDINHVVEGQAAIGVLVARNTDVDDEVLAAALANLGDDLEQEAHAGIERAAVLVGTLVVERGQEAAEHAVGVRRMDLDAVDAGLLHAHGSVTKLVRKLVNLVNCDGTRCLAGIGRAHEGRRDQARRARNVKGHVGGVEELRHDLAAILVHGGSELFPTGNERVVVAAHVARQVGIGGLDRHDLGNDEAHAALGAGAIMVNQVVGHISVVGQVGGYRRHKDTVLDLGRTNLDGAKEHRIGGGLHTGFLSFEPRRAALTDSPIVSVPARRTTARTPPPFARPIKKLRWNTEQLRLLTAKTVRIPPQLIKGGMG